MPQQHCGHVGGNLEENALVHIFVTMWDLLTGFAEAQRKPMRGVLKRVSKRN